MNNNNCELCKIFTILFPYYGIRNKILEYYGDYHTSNDLEYSDSIDIMYDRSPIINELDCVIINFSIFCKSGNIIEKYRLMFSEFFNDAHHDVEEIINIINKYNLKINFKGIYNDIHEIPEKNVLSFDNNGKLLYIDVDIDNSYLYRIEQEQEES